VTDIQTLAAGVLCVGFDGTEIDAALEERLHRLQPAGVILFGRNVESLAQTRALSDRIRALYPNAIIAIDQEGGRVARLREGVEQIPAMMAVGAADDVSLAYRAGAQVAFDLRRAGANVDFAPVLDLALYPMNTVIGARSFGDDPAHVASFGSAVANGLRSEGIVPTFKHFPGHGSTEVDSHLDLPAIDVDEGALETRDLLPFEQLLPNADAVMTAHIVVRALDEERPATISRRILTDVLRDRIRFEGVCFTDCMQMAAIAEGIGSAAGALEALIAGADCVLVSHSFDVAQESIERIIAGVQSGVLPRERLEEAYQRVARLRSRLKAPLDLDARPPHAGIGREIGRRAVTLIRGQAHANAEQSVVLSFEGTTSEGVQGLHSQHATLPSPVPLQQFTLALEPEERDADMVISQIEALQKRPIVLMRRAHVYAKQMRAVERVVQAFPQALVVSTREPFDALSLGSAMHLLCIYGDDAPSLEGLSDVIFRGAGAPGRMPLQYTQVSSGC
jgi:beta-N-acetylhexosaminidase